MLAACGGEASPPADDSAEPPTAIEVAEYLDRVVGFDDFINGDADDANTAFNNADVHVQIYDSESELRQVERELRQAKREFKRELRQAEREFGRTTHIGQRAFEENLGRSQPTLVACGVIEVSVTADEIPREAIQQDYAQAFERALNKKYDC